MTNNNPICLVEEIRLIETLAKKRLNLTDELLMQRSALAAFKAVERFYPKAKRIIVVCGGGKNAADGYVFARYAQAAGIDVALYPVIAIENLKDPIRHIALISISEGIPILSSEDFELLRCDLLVDAMFGIGLQNEVSEPFLSIIEQINCSNIPVLSLDVPSGLAADSGMVQGIAIKANLTVTMIAAKLGFYMNAGPDYVGRVIVNNLELTDLLDDVICESAMVKTITYKVDLPKKPRNCHKGDFGHVLIIGGNLGMPGAPMLASIAALTVGAGKVSLVTRDIYASGMVSNHPEIMVHGIENSADLLELFSNISVVLIGPGLGEDSWASQMLSAALELAKPMVVDASALRLLAKEPIWYSDWVLTPHPGEAAALLNIARDDVNNNRFGSINKIITEYGGVTVLKGLGSLVADESQVYLATAGNPSMATAGMGDALSGIIAGLIANGFNLIDAANTGVMLHARAADFAANRIGERGLLVSDLWTYIRALVNDK
jgi:hydroxyethylthiazole kinase-like uncharacterized protein yjeF